jgi:hypothetical protein
LTSSDRYRPGTVASRHRTSSRLWGYCASSARDGLGICRANQRHFRVCGWERIVRNARGTTRRENFAEGSVSTVWLVYKGDRDQMFSKSARAYSWFAQYSALEKSRTTLLSGDHDVFGDGTVVVIATPGHTEGHCSLLVRLKNTGPVVLCGDLYHYAEERTLKRMPDAEKTTGTAESRQRVEGLLQQNRAQLWIGHSMDLFRTVRKSPAWYD